MKKNKMMRLASILLVCVLLSTSVISGTFAKYTTQDTASDSARVAKWGVTVDVASDAFSDSYKDTATTYDANEKGTTITVQASTKDTKVVAPGTEGTLATVALAGTPEVDVTVTYTGSVTLTGWEVDPDGEGEGTSVEYCPIEITVGSTTYKVDAANENMNTVSEMLAAVNAAITGYTATYDANTDLAKVTSNAPVITWKWAYTGNNDTYDSLLGDAASATIAITLTVEVTQVN